MTYKDSIVDYFPVNNQEASEKEVILSYIEHYPDTILLRENTMGHLTSSGFIMNEALDKVLVIYHKIYQSWGWTGGHADGDADLLHVAIKEAMEETGVSKIRPLMEQIASLDILPVWGHMKKGVYVPTHMHLSVAYVLIADETETLTVNEEETNGVMWIKVEALKDYCNEPPLLEVYNKLIDKARAYRTAHPKV